MPNITSSLIFDIGNVLVKWEPKEGYRKRFVGREEDLAFFCEHVCSFEWNDLMDAGASFADVAPPLIQKYPTYKDQILAWPDAWNDMFPNECIKESIQILEELKNKGHPLYALTNWPAEYWPRAEVRFPFLTFFDGIVVSGIEKVRKPTPRIFEILLDRYKVNPTQSLFIDDRLENIAAGEALGLQGHLFSTPENLRVDLKNRKLL